MTPTASRILADAAADVRTAHDALTLALAKFRAAGVIERRLPAELEDVWLDLNGCAGPLARILNLGLLEQPSPEIAS